MDTSVAEYQKGRASVGSHCSFTSRAECSSQSGSLLSKICMPKCRCSKLGCEKGSEYLSRWSKVMLVERAELSEAVVHLL